MDTSKRMFEWADDTWDADSIEELENMDNQSVRIFAHEVAQRETEFKKLVRYVRALLPEVNSALQFVQLHGMKPDLKEAHELYQDLSDQTRKMIETEA